MKKLALFLLLIVSVKCKSQFSLGAGIGMSSDAKLAIQLSVSYETKIAGLDIGYIALPSADQPVYLTTQLFKPINISDIARISIHGGHAYRFKSSDNKGLNKHCIIFGVDMEKRIKENGIFFGNLSLTDNKAFLILGLRMVIL